MFPPSPATVSSFTVRPCLSCEAWISFYPFPAAIQLSLCHLREHPSELQWFKTLLCLQLCPCLDLYSQRDALPGQCPECGLLGRLCGLTPGADPGH